jgi:Heparinase II/III-like protein/Heparinase II/III N-terminus
VSAVVGKLRRVVSLPPRLLAAEIAWRAARGAVDSMTRARDLARGPTPVMGSRTWAPFLLSGRERPMKVTLPPAAVAACLAEAEAALLGRFWVLGFGPLDFGSPPAWHTDPVSGITWPSTHHSKARQAWPAGADIKVPWEVSRMHWLVALARATAYTDDSRFIAGAVRWLDAWCRHNPIGWGVNWANTMEVAIRSINLVWAAEILADPVVTGRVGAMLQRHGRHIMENLEYSPSLTSNHYLADVVGLLYVGAALRHTTSGRVWLRFAMGALGREVGKQFDEDGSNFEASTGYHRLSTELVLFALLAVDRLGMPLPRPLTTRFECALDVLSSLRKPDGLLPSVGDEDGGMVVNLNSGREPRDPGPLISTGRALLTSAENGPIGDEFSRWAIGRGAVDLPLVVASAALPRSGRFVLATDAVWCLVECGDVGQRGNGGHAHNDTLGFVLAVGGRELVTDPGTGHYTRDPEVRNRLRGTKAHATVEIDGEEINPIERGSLFRLAGLDRPVVELVELTGIPRRIVASHAGYRRLPDPVTHRRTFEVWPDRLVVTDELLCRKAHAAVVSFPLALGTAVERRAENWLLRGGVVKVALGQLAGPTVPLVPADFEVSPAYGVVRLSTCLRGAVAVQGTTRWSFEFRLVSTGRRK